MTILIKVVVFFVCLWSLFVTALWVLRDPLIYRFDQVNDVRTSPHEWEAWSLSDVGFDPLPAQLSEEGIYGWRINPEADEQVVVFVGNVGRLNDGVFSARPFVERGFGVTVMAYPGASGAPGKPKQQDIIVRAGRVFDAIEQRDGRAPGVYGISMGGAVSVFMIERRSPAFIVLEAPLGDIWAIARKTYPFLPFSLPDVDTWEALSVVRSVDAPALVVHGALDRVVPQSHGIELAQGLGAQFISIEQGGHNDLARWGLRDHVGGFIEAELRK